MAIILGMCLVLFYYGIFIVSLPVFFVLDRWVLPQTRILIQIAVLCFVFYGGTRKIAAQFMAFFRKDVLRKRACLQELTTRFARLHSLDELYRVVKEELAYVLGVSDVRVVLIAEGDAVPVFSSRGELLAYLVVDEACDRIFLDAFAKELSTPLQNLLFLERLRDQFRELEVAQDLLLVSEREKVINQVRERSVRELSQLIIGQIGAPLQDIEDSLLRLHSLPMEARQELYQGLKRKCEMLYRVTKDFLDEEFRRMREAS